MIFKEVLVNDILEGKVDDIEIGIVLRTLKRDLYKYFDDTIPKTFYVFPKTINIYCLSHTLCIEVPSCGQKPYLKLLKELKMYLKENFSLSTEHFDGKTIYLVKKNKNRNLYI